MRYSGSPLAYSFSEHAQTKGSWLVDLGGGGRVAATFVEAPVPRRLATLRGSLEDLLADPALATYEESLGAGHADRRRPPAAADGAAAPPVPARPGARVRARQGRCPRRAGRAARVRSDHAIALDFVRELRGAPATEAESALLQDACDACCDDTEVDTLLSVAGGR